MKIDFLFSGIIAATMAVTLSSCSSGKNDGDLISINIDKVTKAPVTLLSKFRNS